MLNRFIGKNVELTVAFASSFYKTGQVSVAFYGILQEVDDEYCLVSLGFKRPHIFDAARMIIGDFGQSCSGTICIKKAFIVTCLELPPQ